MNIRSSSHKPDAMQKFSEVLTDVCILGVLWLLCSLPIVTIGAASAALHSVMIARIARGSNERVGPFFLSFRQHFKKATLLWLTIFPLMIVFALDSIYYLVWNGSGIFDVTMGIVQLILFAMTIAISCYAFPLLTLYNQNVKHVFMHSIRSCYKHWPWTLLILAVNVAVPALILLGLWHFVFLFAGILGYANSWIMVKIFH